MCVCYVRTTTKLDSRACTPHALFFLSYYFLSSVPLFQLILVKFYSFAFLSLSTLFTLIVRDFICTTSLHYQLSCSHRLLSYQSKRVLFLSFFIPFCLPFVTNSNPHFFFSCWVLHLYAFAPVYTCLYVDFVCICVK